VRYAWAWGMTVLLAVAVLPLINVQANNCYWLCGPFGPVWHCDERYGPYRPPQPPPPRCR